MTVAAISSDVNLTDQQKSALSRKKIFFGHQSVGDNIMQGMKDLMAQEPELKLAFVHSAQPETISGPAFVEAEVGENTDPESKNKAFAAAIEPGIGQHGGIAMYKYCYVDITAQSDVDGLFKRYRENIETLQIRHPKIIFVHITVPLTTVEPAAKAWAKALMGRDSARDGNAKRNEFNSLLRHHYPPKQIFDLAQAESTRLDGSRSFFERNGEKVYTLAPEYSSDGGHLNEVGRRRAAQQLLITLANL